MRRVKYQTWSKISMGSSDIIGQRQQWEEAVRSPEKAGHLTWPLSLLSIWEWAATHSRFFPVPLEKSQVSFSKRKHKSILREAEDFGEYPHSIQRHRREHKGWGRKLKLKNSTASVGGVKSVQVQGECPLSLVSREDINEKRLTVVFQHFKSLIVYKTVSALKTQPWGLLWGLKKVNRGRAGLCCSETEGRLRRGSVLEKLSCSA